MFELCTIVSWIKHIKVLVQVCISMTLITGAVHVHQLYFESTSTNKWINNYIKII